MNVDGDDIVTALISQCQSPPKRRRGRPRKIQKKPNSGLDSGLPVSARAPKKQEGAKGRKLEEQESERKTMGMKGEGKETSSEEEIILHLPISVKDINKYSDCLNVLKKSNESEEKYNNKQIFQKRTQKTGQVANSVFTITDMSCNSSPEGYDSNDSELIETIKAKDDEIKKLREEIKEYKNIIDSSIATGMNSRTVRKMDIKFIRMEGGKQIVAESTDKACFWCTEGFKTIPCYLPEKLVEETYYVSRIFCSYNCAAAYNIDMDDYRVWDRYSLINKLYNTMYEADITVNAAPPREALKKYGGPLSLEEFRSASLLSNKEYRFVMPPMVSIVPSIEEGYKDDPRSKLNTLEDKDNLVLKRTKPLPNANNTLINKIGLKKRQVQASSLVK